MIETVITLALVGIFAVAWTAFVDALPNWLAADLGFVFIGLCAGYLLHAAVDRWLRRLAQSETESPPTE